jgi:hypothetical protein
MRVRYLDTPTATGVIWNNELHGKSDYTKGHGHSDIMQKCNVGDVYINGIGEKFICVYAHKMDADFYSKKYSALDKCEIGDNWSVHMQPTKKDGTIHRALATSEFSYSYYGWESK